MLYNIAPNTMAFSVERRTDDVEQPYAGFNVTPYTGDLPSHVRSCQQRLADYLRIPLGNLVIPHQTHGTRCAIITPQLLASKNREAALDDIDAVITDMPEVCIGVSTADCLPILLYDAATGAVGAVHAGWRGTVARIVVLTIARMYEAFGTQSSDLRCILGPCIGPSAFEVHDDVYDAFHQAGFPMAQVATRITSPGARTARKWYINLWGANGWLLQRVGVLAQNITVAGVCSYTEYNRFFSARRLGIKSGRTFTGILRHEV